MQINDVNRAATCHFELVRIYQRQQDFYTAHLYVQDAEVLLQKVTDENLHADLLLRLATLCPDIGRLREGIVYARQALVRFQAVGNPEQQFKTLLLKSRLYRQLGEYQDAASRLEMARSLQAAHRFGVEVHAQMLNAEVHLAWYRGIWPRRSKKPLCCTMSPTITIWVSNRFTALH
jgi:tetratricopeptide (TPR) repeat protein